jgi:hypothetical protein
MNDQPDGSQGERLAALDTAENDGACGNTVVDSSTRLFRAGRSIAFVRSII